MPESLYQKTHSIAADSKCTWSKTSDRRTGDMQDTEQHDSRKIYLVDVSTMQQ